MISIFSLQNAVYFIMLPCLVSVLLTFQIQGVLKFEKKIVAKRLKGQRILFPGGWSSRCICLWSETTWRHLCISTKWNRPRYKRLTRTVSPHLEWDKACFLLLACLAVAARHAVTCVRDLDWPLFCRVIHCPCCQLRSARQGRWIRGRQTRNRGMLNVLSASVDVRTFGRRIDLY